jgi:hypothetical protein
MLAAHRRVPNANPEEGSRNEKEFAACRAGFLFASACVTVRAESSATSVGALERYRDDSKAQHA